MENLTIDDLNLARTWYDFLYAYHDLSCLKDYAVIEKIEQVIEERETVNES